MNLDRVTMTGADDSVAPAELAQLSLSYPFVEWGILASKSSTGSPRFPSMDQVKGFQRVAQAQSMKMSLHLCGAWVRQLLLGVNELPEGILEGFQRVQLNFHAERTKCDPTRFAHALQDHLGSRQIIFQIDGNGGNEHLQAVIDRDLIDDYGLDVVGLFDVSGGAGIVPNEWPNPQFTDDYGYAYHGYAGGLGPDNLREQLDLIGTASKGARIWIDMETNVRSLDDRQFDLAKVKACLDICDPFVG